MPLLTLQDVEELRTHCNASAPFKRATEWADTKVVLAFGDTRYWLKLYRGQIIDLMELVPVSNALGYDVIIAGTEDGWRRVIEENAKSWDVISKGDIAIEGNLVEANRLHEAFCILIESLNNSAKETRNVA